MGTFAPDIEYFIRMRPGGGYGHTIPGAFLLSLPLGLITLWLLHRVIKQPAVLLMPPSLQRRLAPYAGEFRFFPLARFAAICASMLIGIATHIAWDAFTHRHTWLYYHWEFLHQAVPLPLPHYHSIHWYSIFQLLSSVLGIVLLLAWFIGWYRAQPPSPRQPGRSFSPAMRWGIIAVLSASAAAAGAARWWWAIAHQHTLVTEAGDAAVTAGAVVWWQLVVLGVLIRWRAENTIRTAAAVEDERFDPARR